MQHAGFSGWVTPPHTTLVLWFDLVLLQCQLSRRDTSQTMATRPPKKRTLARSFFYLLSMSASSNTPLSPKAKRKKTNKQKYDKPTEHLPSPPPPYPTCPPLSLMYYAAPATSCPANKKNCSLFHKMSPDSRLSYKHTTLARRMSYPPPPPPLTVPLISAPLHTSPGEGRDNQSSDTFLLCS